MSTWPATTHRFTSGPCPRCNATLLFETATTDRVMTRCLICDDRRESGRSSHLRTTASA